MWLASALLLILSYLFDCPQCSIQLGVFLRRYPAARVLVIFYIVLLHLWVLIVIMTYSPEMHDHHLAEHGPVHPDHVQLADPYDPHHLE